MRLGYPSGVRIIRTPCTGKVEVEYLMRALESGADGVLVAGCEEGSCHFIQGNLMARRRVDHVRKIIEEAGLDPDRVRMVNVGASNARGFVQAITEMTLAVQSLGPNPLGRSMAPALQENRP
jgi:coenzyme F420-reducing hydrogenase delta subunit